jgi:SNF2 family DNA or RNA helicase
MNRTDDLYSLLALVDLKRFGSYWSWASRFCKITSGYEGHPIVGGVKEEERENLDRLLSSYALGRPKEVGVKLPPRTRRTVEYKLKGKHLELYKEFEDTDMVTLTGRTVDVDVKIAALTRLRQLAISPLLLDPVYSGPDKFDPLIGVIREKSSKAVVFSMYADAIRWGAWKLNAVGIKSVTFEGSLNNKQRKSALKSFQLGDTQVLLATLKTAGEGLDLVEADRVVFIDLPWQQEGINQGENRIYRFGQKADSVETIFIHACETVEDHVREIISRKAKVTINDVLKSIKRSTNE